MDVSTFVHAAAAFPLPSDCTLPAYGTAGFRANASILGSTVFRCGALIALRAIKLDAITGLMITASHNPEADNGVKLVEPLGEMLVPQWESYATAVAHATSSEGLRSEVLRVIENEGVVPRATTVVIAYDTRPSSVDLAAAAVKGAESMGATVINLGLRTTPQLHWAVRAMNCGAADSSEEAYYAELATAFGGLVLQDAVTADTAPLLVDCANGVGAPKLQALNKFLGGSGLSVEVRNSGAGVLNKNCGSDHVHTKKQVPEDFGPADVSKRCASVDGDADRLIFFSPLSDEGNVALFDGDKIACLLALFLKDVLAPLPDHFKMGVVQTAYANGAATKYLKEELNVEVAVAKTGVKHLHAEAVKFDTGIYFESNGHGTVVFSDRLLKYAEENQETPAAKQLLALSKLINQAVGDAISGILAVECILRRKGWTLEDWGSMYSDLASRQLKVRVKDRSVVKTTEDEGTCVYPEALQPRIEAEVARLGGGRAFVRPSGTEDVVRVYAEAATQDLADQLASAVAKATHDLAGGVGDLPLV